MKRSILSCFSILVFGFALLLLPASLSAAEPASPSADPSEAEAPDVKSIVLGHIGDAYEWHMATIGGREWTIPLPVLVHSPSSGWHCFSSKHLREGAEHEGLRIAAEGEHAGKIVERQADGSDLRPLDLSITKVVAGLLINSLIVVLLVLGVARWYRGRKADSAAPRGFVGLFESLVDSLLTDIIEPCVGPDYRRFAPYLLTVFFFIFVNNLMGLIPFFPGGANVTGNIAVTLVLAAATFLAVNLFGSRHYWKDIFWSDVPTWLKVPIPIIPFIELVGIFTKPFALMIRLFANMMAGHAVILILTCVIFVTAKAGVAVNSSMTAVSMVLSIFMNCLELLVAYLQAYVFTMLSAVFIGLAQERGDEEPERLPGKDQEQK
ncbi:F0F1 ATP synthase subunit A [Alistipes sp.]|uniref:F0F1 ATP synthase subunit A n=1 Tax=Alistipes sp. TaxID=1872444 RepID=UPI0025BD1CA7|nr:F0F1 ATP synthase subunit A [Alistipes sp.]MCI7139579.1 F0F1 ATP synthase subunit A [Alistipes sp.]MDY5396536.1 F0F1 ATP synthase subunit A [Alistipes sp.]